MCEPNMWFLLCRRTYMPEIVFRLIQSNINPFQMGGLFPYTQLAMVLFPAQ